MLRWKRFYLKSFKDLPFRLTSWIHLELIYKHDSCYGSDFVFPIYRANCSHIIRCLFYFILHDSHVTSDVFKIHTVVGLVLCSLSYHLYPSIGFYRECWRHTVWITIMWMIVLLVFPLPSSCRGLLPCHTHGRLGLESTEETLMEVTCATSEQKL